MILDERTGNGWRMVRGDSLLVLRDLPASSVDALGRRFVGVETSPSYYEIACRRMAEVEASAARGSTASGQVSMFGGGK